MKYFKSHNEFLNEANKGKVHKAAKQGSYPAVVVVVQDGKVIHQEPVSTPEVAPATFNVMQKKYPKALLHLEDKTGKRLFSESVTEAKELSKKEVRDLKIKINNARTIGKYFTKDEVEFLQSLFESEITEGKFNKRSLMKAMKRDDGMIQLGNGQEYVIYNPNNGNQDNTDMWDDDVIFALDQDGEEHEIKYSDIVSYNESRKINLKAAHLSSEEYQKAKKLKDFDKGDWEWNSKSGLYDRVNEATDVNDPVLIAYRATRRDLPKLKIPKVKSRRLSFDKYMDLLDARLDIDQQIKDLRAEMAQTLRDMEQ